MSKIPKEGGKIGPVLTKIEGEFPRGLMDLILKAYGLTREEVEGKMIILPPPSWDRDFEEDDYYGFQDESPVDKGCSPEES